MSAKMSKKELESPDVFQSSLERFSDYIRENKTRSVTILTAFVLAMLIAFGIYLYWNNYQASAIALYARAQDDLSGKKELSPSAEQKIKIFKELIEKYPHSWSARMARYRLGNAYFDLGQVELAIDYYKDFVSSSSSDNAGVRFLALTSLGYCYEKKKDWKNALAYFEEAQKSNSTGFESIALRNIARIYEEQNDKKKALEYYQNALEKTTDPAMTIFIKRKISVLS